MKTICHSCELEEVDWECGLCMSCHDNDGCAGDEEDCDEALDEES